ncbi:DNA polymerase I [Maridesulfovibrio ferrireducens]|uniref:DNA polymerase I n=1 Tax=Maridesulfovibrio ferrireducens TaxID=246191 RepID=UPI001A2A3182|nr:DNA polymerase I [Maridesulfovibrio ferrireducens]MBI9111846.1 DNA polymerase I [Maridesulfovibrio ferrireducens]
MSLSEKLNFEKSPLYLIDGSAFFYRGFHAYPDLKRSDGFPTNALYIVLRVLLKVIKEEKPEYLVFMLDGKGKNFRHELFPDYKAQRPPMPDDLRVQVEPLKEAIRALGVPLIVSDGEEADDCIASLAARFKSERPVVILGADKDLKQCLDENVFMWDPAGRAEKITSLADFKEDTGLNPDQWADFQALIGDSADNIPGVPGVGKVTASKLMAKYPTLEDIRDNFKFLQPNIKKKMEGYLETIFTYRKLTSLSTDSCAHLELADLKVSPVNRDDVVAYLNTYEFRSMIRDVNKAFPDSNISPQTKSASDAGPTGTKAAPVTAKGKKPAAGQFSLFGDVAPAPVESRLEFKKVQSVSDLPDFTNKDVGLVRDGKEFYVGVEGDEWLCKIATSELVEVLQHANKLAVADVKSFFRSDPAWRKIPLSRWFDLSLAAYLLNPEDRNYQWDRLRSMLFTGDELPDAVDEVHPEAQGMAALALMHVLAPRIESAGLENLVNELEIPLVPVLADMEEAGISIDLDSFTEFLKEVSVRIQELTKVIHERAEEPFNIRSSQQMSNILFDKLGLKPSGKTPKGALSTANSVLEKLMGQHEIIADILEFRKMEKLRSTYLEPLPKLVGHDGRIHTNFNQFATATGRLSSSGPNLQNIPIRGDMGKRMRACFTAGEGLRLAAADYSQVELRVLAHFSGDPTLISAFENDEDIHSRTAALLFDKESTDITREERGNAKTINFGLIYGMGPQKLSRELGISLNEAKDFIAKYFEKLGVLRDFYDSVVEQGREKGYVTTLSGRRRLLPELHSTNPQVISQARRQAINTVIQGSAADIIKMAMIKVADNSAIAHLGGRLILQIHDELLVEGPEESIEEIGKLLQEDMQLVTSLAVPLKVDLGLGKNWAQAH